MLRYIIVFFLFLGCQRQFQKAPASSHKVLRTCFSQDPTTLDPTRSSDFISSSLICLLYEGLTRCTGGSEVSMALANKVEISPNGKTYLFFLRKSFWTDGHPVTARDFEKSWKKILDPQFLAPCAYLLYPIKNAERYAKGLCPVEDVAIYAVNDLTLRVDLEVQTPYFLSLTAFPLYLPSPSHLEMGTSYWTGKSKSYLVTNGPFYLERFQPGVEISLKKNSRFWNPSQIALDQIHISIIPNAMTAMQLFEKGELDLVGGPFLPLTNDVIEGWKRHNSLYFLPMAASTFCTMNTTSFPFNNFALRKALSLAIEGSFSQEILEMGQIPAERFLPPSLEAEQNALYTARNAKTYFTKRNCQNICQAQLMQKQSKLENMRDVAAEKSRVLAQAESVLDLSAARRKQGEKSPAEWLAQALEELQITKEDLKSLSLYYRTNPLEKKVAQTLQKMWAETLGIFISIEQIEPKALAQKLYHKNYQISIASWIAQFHDPINILDRFKDVENQKNYSGWTSPLYKECLRQIVYTRDPDARMGQVLQAAELLETAAPLIPLYHWSSPVLINPRVQNLETTHAGGVLLERCSILELIDK